MKKAWVVLALTISCGSEDMDETVTPSTPCERLRSHLVELRLAGAPGIDTEAHRAAQIAAMGTEFLTSCGNLSDDAVACALEAPDMQAAGACTSAGASQ